ncbi:MAG TPA: hypothetical protein PKD00_03225 [Burkholderiales bacterium]|nr:hypothetical protein [Burkholderiales bacterium]
MANEKIENKLLSGYWYRPAPLKENTNKTSMTFLTGKGGAMNLINSYRELGVEDELIETFIEVLTDTHGWQPLSNLIVKNNKI